MTHAHNETSERAVHQLLLTPLTASWFVWTHSARGRCRGGGQPRLDGPPPWLGAVVVRGGWQAGTHRIARSHPAPPPAYLVTERANTSRVAVLERSNNSAAVVLAVNVPTPF